MIDIDIAIADRIDRAIVVRNEYSIEHAGGQSWVVQHPDEPERTYLVDMSERKCSCPDYKCTASGLSIDCKHIIALIPVWEAMFCKAYDMQPKIARPEDFKALPQVKYIDPNSNDIWAD